jgi:hypothetical protein
MCVLDGVNARSLPGFGCESFAGVSCTGFTDGDCLWDLSLGRTGDGKIDGETFLGRLWMVLLDGSGGGKRRRQGTSAGSVFAGRRALLNSPIFYVVYYILSSGGFVASYFRPSRTVPPEPRGPGQTRTLLKFRQLTTSFTH